jgi:formylglycine-generating enzyme required for sulfatase activity
MPAPAPVAVKTPPAPAAQPSSLERYERMTDYLREQLQIKRAQRLAAFEENNELYRRIRSEFILPETLAAAWDWVTKACEVADPGPELGELAWDDRLGRAVVKGQEPRTLSLPLNPSVSLDLAWMEPGSFWMGSLEAEEGRKAEELLHERVIPEGFWMGRVEVTQALWSYLMGTNPSCFKGAGPEAPVEMVSWADAHSFLLKLNLYFQQEQVPWAGVMFRLPTEAEWEYACRAGTTTATYAGDVSPRSANDAPELDPIAWYAGNSGADYEGAWDSSRWPAPQFPHTRAGTHPVGRKAPNAWGLHDTIGSVWEWCAEACAAYPGGQLAPGQETNGVTRGGAWSSQATSCRAATRNPTGRDARHSRTGFRLAASWPAAGASGGTR